MISSRAGGVPAPNEAREEQRYGTKRQGLLATSQRGGGGEEITVLEGPGVISRPIRSAGS